MPYLGVGLNFGINHEVFLNVSMMDATSKEIIVNKTGKGGNSLNLLINLVEGGKDLATGMAIKDALQDLPRVE